MLSLKRLGCSSSRPPCVPIEGSKSYRGRSIGGKPPALYISFAEECRKEPVVCAVESRPLIFLLVEESQRGSSAGAVDDRLDAVRAVVFLIDSYREAPSSEGADVV